MVRELEIPEGLTACLDYWSKLRDALCGFLEYEIEDKESDTLWDRCDLSGYVDDPW